MPQNVETTFAERLASACRYHREAPADYGQQAWLRRKLRDLGSDVSSTAVSNWFAGHTDARPDLVIKLAQILEVDPEWLRHGTGAVSDSAAWRSTPPNGNIPVETTFEVPVPLRPGVIARITNIPADLSAGEAQRLANVILALAPVKE
jgi:hypothetical protein